jgi:hypothetical protein
MNAVKVAYNIMSSNAALTTLVSTRINPLRIPEGSAFPAISYNLISIAPTPTKSGHSRTDWARVQVSIFGTTYQSAAETADAVRTAFEVVTLPSEFNGVSVQTIEFDAQNELTDDESAFAGVYQITQDYIINYTREIGIIQINYLLLEDGAFLLQEDGDKIIL